MRRASLLASIPLAAACAGGGDGAGDLPAGEPGSYPLAEIRAALEEPSMHRAFVPDAPLGIGDLTARIPADNPLTPAKVELGRQLFFDPRLSRDGTIACAGCHPPERGWARPEPARGRGPRRRSAPSLANRVLGALQYADGRAGTLEQQALAAIADPLELAFDLDEALARLNAIEGYRLQFEAVFGGPASAVRLGKAIAAFERTILTGESAFDLDEQARRAAEGAAEIARETSAEREEGEGGQTGEDVADEPVSEIREELEGAAPDASAAPDPSAADASVADASDAAGVTAAPEASFLGGSARRGRDLFFGKAGCSTCHSGENLSDEGFHALGVGMDAREPDLGRALVTQRDEDKGAFRTPSLRDVALTPPYMHDGSLATLREAVEHHTNAPPGLAEQERLDLVAFLESLTGKATQVSVPRLP